MTWTTPRTWAVGELVDKTIMDAHVRDNLNFLRQFPAVGVYNTGSIALPDNTATVLTFDSERYKTVTAMHSTSANTSRLVAPIAGIYLVGAAVNLSDPANVVQAYVEILLNGATVIARQWYEDLGSIDIPTTINRPYLMAANDYMEIRVLQNSDGAETVEADGNYSPEAWLVYLGPTTNE